MMMDPLHDCMLTLALAPALEDELLDALMEHPDLASGFAVLRGQGMGTRVELASAMERVEGRARRVFIEVAMARSNVDALLEELGWKMGSAPIAWWVVPLLGFGRLGERT